MARGVRATPGNGYCRGPQAVLFGKAAARPWPAGCRNIDARDRFCNAVAAFAPVRAPLRGRRDPAGRAAGAGVPLRPRGILRDAGGGDRRLLVIEPSAEGIPR